jgi:hypothetical protein
MVKSQMVVGILFAISVSFLIGESFETAAKLFYIPHLEIPDNCSVEAVAQWRTADRAVRVRTTIDDFIVDIRQFTLVQASLTTLQSSLDAIFATLDRIEALLKDAELGIPLTEVPNLFTTTTRYVYLLHDCGEYIWYITSLKRIIFAQSIVLTRNKENIIKIRIKRINLRIKPNNFLILFVSLVK